MNCKRWHVIALISCLIWLVYYPALTAPLNSVDDVRLAHDLLNRSNFLWSDFWIPRSKSYFRPLVNSSFIVDYLFWGFEAPLLHLENVFLHWVNTLLVYSLCRKVAHRIGLLSPVIPVLAALIFGLHPINTEAVIWVAGRADLLATTFVLIALVCAMQFFNGRHVLWCAATGLAFFAGTLAKETALFLLPGLFIMGWLSLRDSSEKQRARIPIKEFLPAMCCSFAAGLYLVLRASALRGGDAGVQYVTKIITGAPKVRTSSLNAHMDVSELVLNVEKILRGAGFYAKKLLQPFPLNFGIVDVNSGYAVIGFVLILILGLLLWHLSWTGCFLINAMSLASVSLLVALGNISWTPYAERYMYGPAAMLAIGCSLALGKRLQRFGADVYRPYVISVVLLLLTGWFAAVFHRGLVWQDNLSLFTDTVNKSPGFSLAQNELAKALWERGRKAEALEIVRSLDIPDSQVAFLNRVMIFIQEGKLEEARTFLLETLSRRNSQGYHTIILERLIDITELMRARDNNAAQRSVYDDEIIGYLQELWHRTQNPFHLYRLGQRQLVKGNIDGAFESFMRAYEKSPPDSIYREPALKLAEGLKGQ